MSFIPDWDKCLKLREEENKLRKEASELEVKARELLGQVRYKRGLATKRDLECKRIMDDALDNLPGVNKR